MAEYPIVTFAKKAGKNTSDLDLWDMIRFVSGQEPLPPKEKTMKKKTTVPMKSKKVRATAAEGKMIGHEDIVLGLRDREDVKGIIALCKKMWGVTVPPSMLEGAPNLGVLRMRAANIVRGALSRAKRFTGEVYRVKRAK